MCTRRSLSYFGADIASTLCPSTTEASSGRGGGLTKSFSDMAALTLPVIELADSYLDFSADQLLEIRIKPVADLLQLSEK
jgi:hypothetical protein